MTRLRKLGDSNPRYGYPYVSLANWWFQPLTQTSFFITSILFKCGANIGGTFGLRKSFSKIFFTCFLMKEITCYVSNVKRIIFFENIFSHYSWEKTITLLIIIEACGVIRFFTSVFAILRLSPWLLEKFIKKRA